MVEDILANLQKGLFARAVRFFPGEFSGSEFQLYEGLTVAQIERRNLAPENNYTLNLNQKQFEIRRAARHKDQEGTWSQNCALGFMCRYKRLYGIINLVFLLNYRIFNL
jgi:hypothetical protein